MKRALIAIVGLIVTVGLLVVLTHLTTVDRAYENDAAQAAHISSQRADYMIGQHCRRLPPPAAQECAYQARNTEEQQQREERELAAQRQTAWWTKWMGVAAIVGIAVGIIGAWLIYITYRTSVQTAERELRPYLLFDDATIEYAGETAGHGIWRFGFKLVNYGQTPARLISAEIQRRFVTAEELGPISQSFPRVTIGGKDLKQATIIRKGGDHPLRIDVSDANIFDPDLAHGPNTSVAVLARVTYRAITDDDSVAYETERGRVFGYTQIPLNGYGEGGTTCFENGAWQHDQVK